MYFMVDSDLATDGKRVLKPMTKEEWETQRNKIRRVFDASTGRHRLNFLYCLLHFITFWIINKSSVLTFHTHTHILVYMFSELYYTM